MQAERIYPAKAEFGCGAYDDGDGFRVTVGYDTTVSGGHFKTSILLDEFEVTFEHEFAEEVCAAIMECATAIRARTDGEG